MLLNSLTNGKSDHNQSNLNFQVNDSNSDYKIIDPKNIESKFKIKTSKFYNKALSIVDHLKEKITFKRDYHLLKDNDQNEWL